mgnify:CR=1 FL=1
MGNAGVDAQDEVEGSHERSRTVALVALGVLAALALVGDSWGAFWFPWPLAIIGVSLYLVMVLIERRLVGDR